MAEEEEEEEGGEEGGVEVAREGEVVAVAVAVREDDMLRAVMTLAKFTFISRASFSSFSFWEGSYSHVENSWSHVTCFSEKGRSWVSRDESRVPPARKKVQLCDNIPSPSFFFPYFSPLSSACLFPFFFLFSYLLPLPLPSLLLPLIPVIDK